MPDVVQSRSAMPATACACEPPSRLMRSYAADDCDVVRGVRDRTGRPARSSRASRAGSASRGVGNVMRPGGERVREAASSCHGSRARSCRRDGSGRHDTARCPSIRRRRGSGLRAPAGWRPRANRAAGRGSTRSSAKVACVLGAAARIQRPRRAQRPPRGRLGCARRVRRRRAAHAGGRRDGAAARRRRPRPAGGASTGARPAARRARALPRHLRAGARLPAARPRDARAAARRGDRRHGRAHRRLPRAALVREARRPARSPPACRCGSAIWVDRFTFPFLGIHALPAWVGIPLTILWIVAIMNMFNFLDGLDGLAAGVAAIAGLTFAVIALSLGKPDAAILSAIVFGACVGFLRHNFYPARIFMGDSGALLLGFVLATVSVQGLLKTAATVALFFPLLVLAVPIVDTTFVVAAAAPARGEGLRGRPGAPAPPLPPARLLAAARGADDLGVVPLALARGASRRASSRSARTASGTRGGRSLAGAVGLVAVAVLRLRRLRARDREAREPDPEAPPRRRSAQEDRVTKSASSVVERRAEALHRVAGAREDGALGAEPLLEHVADRLERARCARPRRRASGTARRASASSGISASDGRRSTISVLAPCSSAGVELARRHRRADGGEERREERRRIARPLAPQPLGAGDERVHRRHAARDRGRRRLDHRERARAPDARAAASSAITPP